jgi:type I restriction enzyme S subunit
MFEIAKISGVNVGAKQGVSASPGSHEDQMQNHPRLGRVPIDWKIDPISATIASLDAGVSVNSEDRPHAAGEIGVLKTSALSGGSFHPEQNKAIVPAEERLASEPVASDSILVSRMNTPELVGESCYVQTAYPTLFLPDRIWQLKPKDRDVVCMRWLSYVLRMASCRAYVEVHASGTSGTMKNLPKAKLLEMEVAYPSFPEQKSISMVLDTLDTNIRQTEAIITKLQQVKQGLLHDLLTRGIDANGELRPPVEVASHLYKESPLGWIPKEWEVVTLGQIAQRSGGLLQTGPFGSQLHAHEYVSDGVPVIMPQDMVDSELSVAQIARISQRKATVLSRHRVQANDIVFSRRGDLSRCVAIKDQHTGWLCGTGCLLARLSNKEINGYWLALVYQQPAVQTQVMGRAVGSTMANLNSSILGELTLSRPDIIEQNEVAQRLESISKRIEHESLKLEKLNKTKSGLMDDLLTGCVRVTPLLTEGSTTK